MIQERLPPHDQSAEAACLGGILLDNKALNIVAAAVNEEDFYADGHRRIFASMLEMFREGRVIDHVTLGDLLSKTGDLEKIGGAKALGGLTDCVVTVANIGHYANIVKEKAAVRRAIYAGQQIVAEGFGDPADPQEYLANSRKLILDASQTSIGRDPVKIGAEASTMAAEAISGVPPVNIVPTGFRAIDSLVGGLMSPLLHIVGARPSMGKSAFLLNMGINLSLAGKKVLYCTLEDSAEFQRRRALARLSDTNLQEILMNQVRDEQIPKLHAAIETLSGLNLWIQDRPMTSMQVCQECAQHQNTHGLDIVMIDHLGYVRDKGDREYDINSAAVRNFANLGKELGIPVILAVQLNRKVEERPNPIPKLADLRGSGRIEEDARSVWFLFREAVYNEDAEKDQMMVKVAKSSHGKIGPAMLYCDLSRMFIADNQSLSDYPQTNVKPYSPDGPKDWHSGRDY